MHLRDSVAAILLLPIVLMLAGVDAAAVIEHQLKQEKKQTNSVQANSAESQQILPLLMYLNTQWRRMRANNIRELEAAKIDYLKKKRIAAGIKAWHDRVERDIDQKTENNEEPGNVSTDPQDKNQMPQIKNKDCTINTETGKCEEGVTINNAAQEDVGRSWNEMDKNNMFNWPDKETNSIDEFTDHNILYKLNEILSSESSPETQHFKELDIVKESDRHEVKKVNVEIEGDIKPLPKENNCTNCSAPCNSESSRKCDQLPDNENKQQAINDDGRFHGKTHISHAHEEPGLPKNVTHVCNDHHGIEKESKAHTHRHHTKHGGHHVHGDGSIHMIHDQQRDEYNKHRYALLTDCLQRLRASEILPQHGVSETEQRERLASANRLCAGHVRQLLANRSGHQGSHDVLHSRIIPAPARDGAEPFSGFLGIILARRAAPRTDPKGKGMRNIKPNSAASIATQQLSKHMNQNTEPRLKNNEARYKRRLEPPRNELAKNYLKRHFKNAVVKRSEGNDTVDGSNNVTSSEQLPVTLQPTTSEQLPVTLQPTSSEQLPVTLQPTSSEQLPITLQPTTQSLNETQSTETTNVTDQKQRLKQKEKDKSIKSNKKFISKRNILYKEEATINVTTNVKQGGPNKKSPHVDKQEGLANGLTHTDHFHRHNSNISKRKILNVISPIEQALSSVSQPFEEQNNFTKKVNNSYHNEIGTNILHTIADSHAEFQNNSSTSKLLTSKNRTLTDRKTKTRRIYRVKRDGTTADPAAMNPSSSYCPEIELSAAMKREIGVNIESSPVLLLFASLFSFINLISFMG